MEYTDSAGNTQVEIVLDQDASDVGGVTVDSPNVNYKTGTLSTSGNTVQFELSGDVTPNQNLTVTLSTGGDGPVVVQDIQTTATSVTEAGAVDETVYKGEPVAIVSNEDDEKIRIQGGGATTSSSTGSGSNVYVYNTLVRPTGSTSVAPPRKQ